MLTKWILRGIGFISLWVLFMIICGFFMGRTEESFNKAGIISLIASFVTFKLIQENKSKFKAWRSHRKFKRQQKQDEKNRVVTESVAQQHGAEQQKQDDELINQLVNSLKK